VYRKVDTVQYFGHLKSELTMTKEEFDKKWTELDASWRTFCIENVFESTYKAAAEKAGIAPQTYYNKDEEYKEMLDELTKQLVKERREGLSQGIQALSKGAVQILRQALDPNKEISRVEKEAASYIIDRIKGKPTRKQEVQHSGGIDFDPEDEEKLDEMLGHLDSDDDEEE